jgi:16S rRNA (uracil1498-N3)-methyltransferase
MAGDTDAVPGGGASARRHSAAHVLVDGAEALVPAQLTLDEDVEHHLLRVIRLGDGEPVSATDGAGSWRMYRTRQVGKRLIVEADADVEFEPRSSTFALASAIPKGDRVEWMVQKTTELGVDRIVLLHADRSVVRWKTDRVAKNLVRLQRIADEATRQSRRVWRTTVCAPEVAAEVVAGAAVAEPSGEPIRGDEPLIAIGPEGGWSADELARSARRVGVSENVLRVETAALAVATLRMVLRH